jgi:hypothetical protein
MTVSRRLSCLAEWGHWSYLAAGLAALGLAVGLWGQRLVDQRAHLPLAAGLLLASVCLSVLATAALRPERAAEPVPASFPILLVYLRWSLVFALLAFMSLKGNRFGAYGLLAWVLAVALAFLALPGASRRRTSGEGWFARLRSGQFVLSWQALAVLLAIGVGAFLRVYRLLELPADLGWDLPYNYTDGQRILRGEYLVFFPDNYGREGMFFYLIAVVAKVVGLSPYSIRLTSALVGIAALPAIYALARESVDGPTAVIATWLLALNKWHLVLSRSGYRVSLQPLFSILLLYGLARGLRRGTPRDWAWAGLFMGLGLWTYKSFVVAVPLAVGTGLLVALLGALRPNRASSPSVWGARPKRVLQGVAIMLLVALVVFVPMVRFMVDSPQVYLARELQGGRLVQESLARADISRVQLTVQSAITSLLMFNYEGDGNSRFGVPFQRHMGRVSGVLLLLGLGMALVGWRRGGNLLWLLALAGLVLPMTVSMLANEKPNCFRSFGAVGPAVLLGALALRNLLAVVQRCVLRLRSMLLRSLVWTARAPTEGAGAHGPAWLWIALVLVAGLLVGAEGRETYRFYFTDFRLQAPDQANFSVALAMSQAIIDYEDGPAYVRAWPYWYDGRALNAHLDAAGRAHSGELQAIGPELPPLRDQHGPLLIILPPDDQADLALLQRLFPRWFVKVTPYPSGEPALVAFYGESD